MMLEGKFSKKAVRITMFYSIEFLGARKRSVNWTSMTIIRILTWMFASIRKYRIRNAMQSCRKLSLTG